ncbi:MAG: hypothetical protein U0525_06520 [Patescibacteria group bacterium]
MVSKTFVDKESDWQKSDIYSERKSELGCIDNDGNISKAPEQNIVKLKESLAKKLTDKINFDTHEQKYKVYENDIYVDLKLNSFIFRFNKKSSVYDADIYLASLDNPENDWTLLGQGADIVWK